MRRARYLAIGGLRAEAGAAHALGPAAALRPRGRAGHPGRPRARQRPRREAEPVAAGVPRGPAAPRAHRSAGRSPRPAGDVVRVRWTPETWPKVSVVIPTRHNRTMLSTCLPSLARTDYPDFEVVIVDNGGHSEENEKWYADNDAGLGVDVLWWDVTPFNYSAGEQRRGAARPPVRCWSSSTTTPSCSTRPGCKELVGWAVQPEIGIAGLQLTGPDGKIQHTGVILGLGGFADHVFEGMRTGQRLDLRVHRLVPRRARGDRRLLRRRAVGRTTSSAGSTSGSSSAAPTSPSAWTPRSSGLRNVCSPFAGIRHLESATRGTVGADRGLLRQLLAVQPLAVRRGPVLQPEPLAGQPAAGAAQPARADAAAAGVAARSAASSPRSGRSSDAGRVADARRHVPGAAQRRGRTSTALHARNAEPFDVRTINWYIPDIDSPFYGGINSALRIADHLARTHGCREPVRRLGQPAGLLRPVRARGGVPGPRGLARSSSTTAPRPAWTRSRRPTPGSRPSG